MSFTLDHIAIATTDLARGTAETEARLGVALAPGGSHARMGTHNRLLGLGPEYLEVIAIDPDAPAPARPRWFDLDRFEGPTRLTNWILRTDDLDAALAALPAGFGPPVQFTRGDLSWRMAVPDDGILPWDGLAPALIQWDSDLRPPARLPEAGCRLTALRLTHPDAASLAALFPLDRVTYAEGPPALSATLATPTGEVVL